MEDNKKRFEVYGLYDIEKIQSDIEKDLNSKEKPANDDDEIIILEQKEENLNIGQIFEDCNELEKKPQYIREKINIAGLKIAIWLIVCTVGMASLGFGLGTGWAFFRNETTPYDTNEQTNTTYIFRETTNIPIVSLADMLELIEPSVVNIITDYNDRMRENRRGSGIIFHESEEKVFIVTNLYVVQDGIKWELIFSGGASLYGHVVGSDRHLGLAVLSVYKSEIVDAGIEKVYIASFGDSDKMMLGDWVFAIGNSMGEGNAVTRGIISALNVSVEIDQSRTQNFLQTDAAINYGNSGGPLINTRGEIIGINYNLTDFLFGRSLVEGMGYSIPSNDIVSVLYEIVNNPPVALGISGRSLSEEAAERLGIPHIGVAVESVFANSSADNAGIQRGDIITGFAGETVFDFDELVRLLRLHSVGDEVEIRIFRNQSDWIVLTVVLRPAVFF